MSCSKFLLGNFNPNSLVALFLPHINWAPTALDGHASPACCVLHYPKIFFIEQNKSFFTQYRCCHPTFCLWLMELQNEASVWKSFPTFVWNRNAAAVIFGKDHRTLKTEKAEAWPALILLSQQLTVWCRMTHSLTPITYSVSLSLSLSLSLSFYRKLYADKDTHSHTILGTHTHLSGVHPTLTSTHALSLPLSLHLFLLYSIFRFALTSSLSLSLSHLSLSFSQCWVRQCESILFDQVGRRKMDEMPIEIFLRC